jgi:hypothetical protein
LAPWLSGPDWCACWVGEAVLEADVCEHVLAWLEERRVAARRLHLPGDVGSEYVVSRPERAHDAGIQRFPRSVSQSDAFRDTARTLTSTSWSLGAGISTPTNRSTPGGPYRVQITAFMAFLLRHLRTPCCAERGSWIWGMDVNGAEINPAQPSRSSRIGAHDLNVPTSQLAMHMGEAVDGQGDHRPVQQRRRIVSTRNSCDGADGVDGFRGL